MPSFSFLTLWPNNHLIWCISWTWQHKHHVLAVCKLEYNWNYWWKRRFFWSHMMLKMERTQQYSHWLKKCRYNLNWVCYCNCTYLCQWIQQWHSPGSWWTIQGPHPLHWWTSPWNPKNGWCTISALCLGTPRRHQASLKKRTSELAFWHHCRHSWTHFMACLLFSVLHTYNIL